MEIFGGFMVMVSIFGFFLAVIWFILPFVIFAMKGKVDRSFLLLESMDRRLAAIEERLRLPGEEPPLESGTSSADSPPAGPSPPVSGE